MSGKLGQSLRKYSEEAGAPDFELEKFAVNSVLSATHTSQMDAEDQKDIINKVKTSGNTDKGEEKAPEGDNSNGGDVEDVNVDVDAEAPAEDNVEESKKKDNGFLIEPKKSSIFAPEGSREYEETIKNKLNETFNQDSNMQPAVEPEVKPAPVRKPEPAKPSQPSRKNKPFLPSPSVQPNPKAMAETNATPEAKQKLDTSVMARELASMSKNINDMISKQVKFFAGKDIKDAKDITSIIATAAELIKNR